MPSSGPPLPFLVQQSESKTNYLKGKPRVWKQNHKFESKTKSLKPKTESSHSRKWYFQILRSVRGGRGAGGAGQGRGSKNRRYGGVTSGIAFTIEDSPRIPGNGHLGCDGRWGFIFRLGVPVMDLISNWWFIITRFDQGRGVCMLLCDHYCNECVHWILPCPYRCGPPVVAQPLRHARGGGALTNANRFDQKVRLIIARLFTNQI